MKLRTCGLVLAGIVAAGLSGCHHYPYGGSYYSYGPGPYTPAPTPTYGPMMAPPGGTYMSPGPTYSPMPQNLSPTPIGPSSPSSPTPISPSQPQPTWTPDNSSDAPPYRPNSNNLVPDPLDPDFSAPPPAAAMPRAMPLAEVPRPMPVTAASAHQTVTNDAELFEAPRRLPAMPTEADPFDDTAARPRETLTQKQEPYGHDKSQYTWLRGLADYDEDTQTWSIIYNLTPDPHDRFGGSFVFAPHPSLQNLRPGALVLAKGRADPGRKDPSGKPLYEIQQLIPLAPPADMR